MVLFWLFCCVFFLVCCLWSQSTKRKQGRRKYKINKEEKTDRKQGRNKTNQSRSLEEKSFVFLLGGLLFFQTSSPNATKPCKNKVWGVFYLFLSSVVCVAFLALLQPQQQKQKLKEPPPNKNKLPKKNNNRKEGLG